MTLRHGTPMVAIPGPRSCPNRYSAFGSRCPTSTKASCSTSPGVRPAPGNRRHHRSRLLEHRERSLRLADGGHPHAQPGDKVLVLESGAFRPCGDCSERSGIEVETLPATPRHRSTRTLRPDSPPARPTSSLPFSIHVDGDFGRNDIKPSGARSPNRGHRPSSSSTALRRWHATIHMDAWGVDITIAVAEGSYDPTGLGIVWVNERAINGRNADLRNGYFDWHADSRASRSTSSSAPRRSAAVRPP